MGMFDKDKEIGLILQQHIPENQQFIVWGVRIKDENYPTEIGPAVQSELTISGLDDPQGASRYEVTTLASAIASKVREAEPDDFPAVVYWTTVESKKATFSAATVLRFVRPLHAPREAPATSETPETPTA